MTDMPHALGDKISKIAGYKPYFRTAFGSEEITGERIAKAIVAYEQTRMSGNSAWDRWRYDRDEKAVSVQVTHGHELFFRKAKCRGVIRSRAVSSSARTGAGRKSDRCSF